MVWLVLAIGGCASFNEKPLNANQTLFALESRSLSDPGLREFLKINLPRARLTWPLATWNLTQLTVAAFYYHPDLDVARAEVGLAEAGSITAGMRPNPTLNFTPQFNSNPLDAVSPWTLGWSLNLPIETANKRGLRLEQARHQSEAARYKLRQTAWQVRSRLRAACLALSLAQRRREVLQSLVEVQARTARLLDQRLAAGAVSQPEATLAHLNRQQSELMLAEAERENAEAKVVLAQALGLPVQSLTGVRFSLEVFDRLPPAGDLGLARLRQAALVNRLDILKSLADYEASQSALRLEIAKQYPDIQMNPGYQWEEGENKWALGLSIRLPLLNRNEGPIAQAEAGRSLAAANFLTLQNRVLGELDQAAAAYQAAAAKLARADELLVLRGKQLGSTFAQLQMGEVDRLTSTGAEAESIWAKLWRLETWGRAQQALGTVEDSLQRPLAGESGPPLAFRPPQPGRTP